MPLFTSRSCPNRCYFCSIHLAMGTRFRMHSAQRVFEEIRHLYDKYGVNYFYVEDDNFTFDRQRTLDICNLIIKNKLNIYLTFRNGLMIKTLDEEIINALCDAGGVNFHIAIESGSDYIRNTILRKGCSKEKIIDTVNLLRSRNVIVNAFFMIGFPEETEESLLDTMELIKTLNVHGVTLSKVNPQPGTALFDQCKKDNLFREDIDLDSLWTGEHVTSLSMLDGGGIGHFVIKPYQLSLDKLIDYDDKITKVARKKMLNLVRDIRTKAWDMK